MSACNELVKRLRDPLIGTFDVTMRLRNEAADAIESLRRDGERLDWLQEHYYAAENYTVGGKKQWTFSTPLLNSWTPIRDRLDAAIDAMKQTGVE